jgi:hypothetical protein
MPRYSAHLRYDEGVNVSVGTTTGTRYGTLGTQKQGWWGATPVIQSTGWSVTPGYSADKALNPEATTVTEVARVLGTLIDTLKSYGQLGG